MSAKLVETPYPVQLNEPLAPLGDVRPFPSALNEERAVFVADAEIDGQFDLYSVPLAGRPVMSNDRHELYSVPIAGGAPVKLNGPLVDGGEVRPDFIISPDSKSVFYRANQDVDEVDELYIVPISGGSVAKLSETLPPARSVRSNIQISPDGSLVLFAAGQGFEGVNDLYSIPVGGGPALRISGPFVNGPGVLDFRVAPGGQRVLYVADELPGGGAELYSTSLQGGIVSELSGEITTTVPFLRHVVIGPNGKRVVYIEDMHPRELWSIPIKGGAPTKLSVPLPQNGDVISSTVRISPDGSRVFYVANQAGDGFWDLFSVASTGGISTKLNAEPDTLGVGPLYVVSPDGAQVVYSAWRNPDLSSELYSVSAGGGAPLKISPPIPTGGSAGSGFQIAPDSRRVVFRAG